jgi:hypothetical protein
MFMTLHQNAEQNHNLKSYRKKIKTVFMKKIKSRLNSVNVCYHSVQKHLFSHLLSKNLKIKIHKTTNLPVFCTSVKLGLSH